VVVFVNGHPAEGSRMVSAC